MFTGANLKEDPQDFIDEMHKSLWVMRATEMEGVELMKYHWETIKYAEGGTKKKFPIYLLETADSMFSTK